MSRCCILLSTLPGVCLTKLVKSPLEDWTKFALFAGRLDEVCIVCRKLLNLEIEQQLMASRQRLDEH